MDIKQRGGEGTALSPWQKNHGHSEALPTLEPGSKVSAVRNPCSG
jgi:hypothetical protein